ncbi:MAG: hypothetical protein LBI17_01225 [Rickettsiales bacterium]|jgi:hypothetical protein|nr:hypothetical protein [Rickettsiales bacterium]
MPGKNDEKTLGAGTLSLQALMMGDDAVSKLTKEIGEKEKGFAVRNTKSNGNVL